MRASRRSPSRRCLAGSSWIDCGLRFRFQVEARRAMKKLYIELLIVALVLLAIAAAGSFVGAFLMQ